VLGPVEADVRDSIFPRQVYGEGFLSYSQWLACCVTLADDERRDES